MVRKTKNFHWKDIKPPKGFKIQKIFRNKDGSITVKSKKRR